MHWAREEQRLLKMWINDAETHSAALPNGLSMVDLRTKHLLAPEELEVNQKTIKLGHLP